MSLTLVPQRPNRAFAIAVTSGKGGVGKTSVAIHLAAALAGLRRRVALVDADFALGNIDVRLGLTPVKHLGAVLDGDCAIDDVTVAGPMGIDVVPAASGVRELSQLTSGQWRRLSEALTSLRDNHDFIVIDTATGIGDAVLDVVGLADYALVVTADESAALVDAYATIKLLTEADRSKPVGVLVNAAAGAEEAGRVFTQLSRAARRFLDRSLRDDGYIVEDDAIRTAALELAAVPNTLAHGPAGPCFRRLAARLAAASSAPPEPPSGHRTAVVRPSPLAFTEAPRCA
jgi:flagellar biosynthesis protein FlhG